MAFDNLHLEKGMYREAGKSFTQVLEALDPSENYKGTALEGTDAFQRQLKRFGIRVRGAGSDRVEKFFRTAASAVLFPEYVSRAVRQGMEEDDILPSLVATTTVIDALDYRVVCSEPGENDMELARVAEGAEIPSTRITVSDQLTRLYKRGRMVEASYEALRFQKLDLFSVFLRQIGSSIQNAHIHDAIEVLTEGSGNVSPEILYAGETEIGVLGQIHPLVAANYGVDAEFYCAELSFAALDKVKGGQPVYKPLPRFPSVTRDIAVVCSADIPVGDLEDCILANGGEYLKDVALFDVYMGSHITAGMKSVAFSLTMRSDDQTLTDEHAEETVARVLKALRENFNAVMR